MKLIESPKWHPFRQTTPEALKRAKKERRGVILGRWLRLPPAPF